MGYEAMGCHCSTHGDCEAYEDDDGIVQCAKCRDTKAAREEFKAKGRKALEEWEAGRIERAKAGCEVIRTQLALALARLDQIEPGAIPSGHEEELLSKLHIAASTIGAEVSKLRALPWEDKPDVRENGLPPEVNETLRQFAAENGRTWKSKLRELWSTGRDSGHPLNQDGHLRWVRNSLGPRGLEKVSF